ncbi:hypothetical protein [Hymenobacter terrenus]|uniref:hypothetical protein n=1 Tax=Hymenobacter terrenus TaxID=1629124 RepID=UPI000619C2B9|nr:hypothetical protein [Hymenobacter terrenus]
MPTVVEKKLAFDFPSNWAVIKYDHQADPVTNEPASFYRRTIEKGGVQNVQGVDIICRLPGVPEQLQFIEVKDDRRRTLAVGPRHAELFISILGKTAGTLVGLLLAERLNEPSLSFCACLSQRPDIEVILFLVEPPPVPILEGDAKNALRRLNRQDYITALDQRLTAKLGEWGLDFRLYNLTDRPAPAPDWQVRDLA